MSILDAIMRQPLIYRLWMGPFAEEKFAPIAAHNDLARIHRVLDVGCGPGTNASHFSQVEYLGIDLNEQYIRDAERRLGASQGGRRFLAVDAVQFIPSPGERFDFVFVNSFFHHVDDAAVCAILSNLSNLLTEDGHLHIVELVLPESTSVARILARCDRGNFARPLEEWRRLFSESFEQVLFEPFDLVRGGVTLWKMVYFKGKARQRSTRS